MNVTTGMTKEEITRMCDKSKRLSGAKWKWRRICEKHGLTWEIVEEKFDILIERQEKLYEQIRPKSNEQLGNDTGTESGDGAGESEAEVSATTDSSDIPVRVSGPIDGRGNEVDREEVRSGETENGSSTPEGSK